MTQRFEGYDYDNTGLGYPGWPGSRFAETLMQEVTGSHSVSPAETNVPAREHATETVAGAHWLQLVDGTSI